MSDFARVMEMALEGGATPEDISGKVPPSLAEQLAAAEAEAAKAAAPAPAPKTSTTTKPA